MSLASPDINKKPLITHIVTTFALTSGPTMELLAQIQKAVDIPEPLVMFPLVIV